MSGLGAPLPRQSQWLRRRCFTTAGSLKSTHSWWTALAPQRMDRERRFSTLGHGQLDNEPRADRPTGGITAVLGTNAAAMRLDDLLGNRKTEPGMGAEFFAGGTLAVEAFENRVELSFGN